jgi:hypothetical protein
MRTTVLFVALTVQAGCAHPPTTGAPGAPTPAPLAGVPGAVERVVQAQVEAYNRRDLDAFVAHFAPDTRLYAFPDSLLYAGRDTLRAVYGALFARAAGLRAEVTHRVVQGAYVLDREITRGLPGRGPLTGVAIYEVRDGLIRRVWFVD